MRYFSLEALNAAHGDSLLLHYGIGKSKKLILIDGGPIGVYRRSIQPRLDQLRNTKGKLAIEQVYLSHIDDDHIVGLINLFDDMDSERLELDVKEVLFNSFEDTKPLVIEPLRKAGFSPAEQFQESAAVVASVGQGRSLSDVVRRLGIRRGDGTGKPLVAKSKPLKVYSGNGINITLLGPSQQRLDALRKDWVAKAKKLGPTPAEVAAFLDRSVYNLSSLILLVTSNTGNGGERQSMLLTGDARGDDIEDALNMAGELNERKAHFSILKLPHHGSSRNLTKDFFERITADHYVICANGKHGNPDKETIEWLGSAVKEDAHVWFTSGTNSQYPEIEQRVVRMIKLIGKKRVHVRSEDELSVVIDLQKKIDF